MRSASTDSRPSPTPNEIARSIGTAALALILHSRSPAATIPQGADDIRQRIATADPSHPRLFMDTADASKLQQKLRSDPLMSRTMAFVRRGADAILDAEPCQRLMTGRRLLSVSRTVLKRVVFLAFAHRMTAEPKYAKRAEQEMLAAAAFSDWNPSHFLDVAEMTAALAIGYDWLHDALNADARTEIRDAIVEQGLRPSLPGGWWVKTTNNWNQVCHGGLSLGALAVLEDEPALAAKIIARAIKHLPRAMHEYAPDGAYPEGPGYWKYGTSYNVLLLDALQSVFGADFGLAESPGFLESAHYYVQVTGPTGRFFNYSDCRDKSGTAPALFWFAKQLEQPALLWRERSALDRRLRRDKPSADGKDRLLPFLLLWAPERADQPAPPTTLHFRANGATPIATHRSSFQVDATFVAIKGGSPGANHAHMDIGSFVLDALSERWALDLGPQNYNSLESRGIRLWDRSQDSQRWTVFRLNNLSHNTLVVNGSRQRVKSFSPIESFSAEGPMPHTIVDLSPAYQGQLGAARRGVGLRADRSVLVQDELVTLKTERPDDNGPTTNIRWGMVTPATIQSIDGNTAILEQNGKELTFRVLSPSGVALRSFDTQTPKASHDRGNPGTRMIGFEIELPPARQSCIAVHLAPGRIDEAPPTVVPLSNW